MDPKRDLVPLRDMMSRLFNESFLFSDFYGSFLQNPLNEMKVDVEEDSEKFTIKAELPGADPSNIDLDLAENRLTLTVEMGSEKEDKGKHYIRRECSYGKLQRSFDFRHAPIDTAKSSADFSNGVLKVTLPKKVAEQPRGRKIPINA